jgi:hypothetical protein
MRVQQNQKESQQIIIKTNRVFIIFLGIQSKSIFRSQSPLLLQNHLLVPMKPMATITK